MTKFTNRRIGNGNTTRVWGDPWILENFNFKAEPKSVSVTLKNSLLVKDLICPTSKKWGIPKSDLQDKLIWTPNISGSHLVKYFYLVDREERFNKGNEKFWNKV